MCPASILERSRTLLIRPRSCLPQVWMSDTGSWISGGTSPYSAVADHLGEAEDRVHRRAQLVAHAGEEVGLGPAGLLELGVERAELMRRPPLVVVELMQLAAHLVHPAGEGAELVAVRHVDARAEVALGDLAEEPLGLPDGEDEGPGDDEPEARGRGRWTRPRSRR